MAGEFNFEMTTKYKPEFKRQATYERLYRQLAQERMENEGRNIKSDGVYNPIDYETVKMREHISGNDKSSIKNKLKRQLHLDIKAYDAKSDEEKFNVLKLLYFIVSTKKYEGMDSDSILKTVSVINLIANPSLDHTDANNSVYEEHFRSIIGEIRPAVSDADYREETVNWIHSLWKQMHVNLNLTVLEDVQTHQNALQTINQRLKNILDCLERDKIAQLQRPNEGIIDTFYNILISSRIIAEIEDMKKVVYPYQKEEIVPPVITNLYLDKIFSSPVTWEEFQTMTDVKKIDITDRKMQMVWSMLLCKEHVTAEDLQNIHLPDYRFARKYAEIIAEYWVKEELNHDAVTLGEWIIVMQELMCIRHNEIKYKNCFIRHTNTNIKLTASIKSFEEASQLPHLIVLNRLTNRLLLTYGTKELIEYKLQADTYIMEIEKIIFSYKNIEDIRTAHNCLYFQVISSLATKPSIDDIPDVMSQLMQRKLIENGLPPIKPYFNSRSLFENLMSILIQDKYFRLLKDDTFMEFRHEALQALSNGVTEGMKFIASHRFASHPECAYEVMANMFAEEIKKMYSNISFDNPIGSYSQTLTIPIYFGEGNEYNLHIGFILLHQLNVISISWYSFIGKEVDSFERYKELLLVGEKNNFLKKSLDK